MCGIFGIFSNKLVTKPILDGLTKLEYRGYDSSGISILDNNKKIHTLRAKGKLKNLINKVNKKLSVRICWHWTYEVGNRMCSVND